MGRIENQRKNQNHQDNRIVETSQNTEKSPGDLKRLVVTQSPGNDRCLRLERKTRKEENNNDNCFVFVVVIQI